MQRQTAAMLAVRNLSKRRAWFSWPLVPNTCLDLHELLALHLPEGAIVRPYLVTNGLHHLSGPRPLLLRVRRLLGEVSIEYATRTFPGSTV